MARKEFLSKYTGNEIEAILDQARNTPIYPNYDQKDGYWRIFSSKDNYLLWEGDPVTYADLVIWEFEGKTPREIVIDGLYDLKYILKNTEKFKSNPNDDLKNMHEVRKKLKNNSDNISIDD